MSTFVWAVVALASLQLLRGIFNLATGASAVIPRMVLALNIVLMLALVVWGVWVLRGTT